jgi:ABC-type antimicrobial peptide transport system permease subunit
MKMFLTEAAIISLIGGLLGIGIGNYLIHYLAGNFDLLSKLGAQASFSALNIMFSVLAMLAGVTVCLIGAAIPVIRLANLEPLVAIKED